MSELWKSSLQHRGGLDAGDTDSVDPTPENHGPHRMNRKQTANAGRGCQWRTLANRFEMFFFYACFSHFTVGSSKSRQLTIRGLGLNTTYHDMRPIWYVAGYLIEERRIRPIITASKERDFQMRENRASHLFG